uniref:K+ potassium transporter integral membrane domain-containing protein n=1 Tax=Opuntia streptacantha TaxID=393608 RepID=A0A7C9AFI8_OPUST
MGLLHTFQVGHPHGSLYDDVNSSGENKSSLAIKAFFEKHQSSRVLLLLVVLLGTSMVIGDGILTPTMSVLSAVSGLKIKVPHLNEYYTVSTACIILMILFSLQHYGTRSVGFLFAPIMVAWASLSCWGRVVQCSSLESSGYPSSFTILHLQFLPDNRKSRC